jgi:hypothetical protein
MIVYGFQSAQQIEMQRVRLRRGGLYFAQQPKMRRCRFGFDVAEDGLFVGKRARRARRRS